MVSLRIAVHASNATSHIAAKCGSISRIVGLWSDLGKADGTCLLGRAERDAGLCGAG